MIERQDCPAVCFRREGRRACAGARGQSLTQFFVPEQPPQGCGQRLRRMARYEQRFPSVAHDFRDPTDGGGDDRNPGGWVPEQKITVEQALRAYTSGAAYAAFRDTELGTLAPGMLADVVMIDRDITRVPPETIRDAKVVLTMVGGRVVYDPDRLVK